MNNTNAPSSLPDLLFLIGMPAVGKSYWGAELAKAWQLQFVDLDVYISDHERASIPALFAQFGEAGFRERETKYLKKIIENASPITIVACGGGTPCFNNNIHKMRETGKVVYLKADVPLLLEHLKHSPDARPLLNGRKDAAAFLGELLQKRSSIYEQAHHILFVKDLSLPTFAEIFNSCTNVQ